MTLTPQSKNVRQVTQADLEDEICRRREWQIWLNDLKHRPFDSGTSGPKVFYDLDCYNPPEPIKLW